MGQQLSRVFPVILMAIFAIMILASCNDDEEQQDQYVDTPIAGFTYTGNEGPAPVTVQFYNTSLYSDKFEWDFGDGATSSERDPKHIFYNSTSEVKTYLVVLKAIDSTSGLFQRKSKTLAIQPGN